MPPGPIRGLRFVHTAIRNETASLADRAASIEDPAEVAALGDDFGLLADALIGHAIGEDEGYFGTLDERAGPLCAAYSQDHADEKVVLGKLAEAIASCGTADELAAIQAELAHLRDHSDAHMSREENELWPKTEELFSPPEQGGIIQAILAVIPKEQFPVLIPWIVARNPDDEAVAYVTMLSRVQPPEVFARTRTWLADGLVPAQWSMLCERVEALA
ncbi:MAG: hemerythrin domain-containing protein [Deltaproteobacteria bacterium]|nr:MAG: hemerythrin domain-containing protein [Deltaproteobacteria bacterium]